ncbi:MAG: HlyU family transcriptional regulator [Pseudomonadota bacterium]
MSFLKKLFGGGASAPPAPTEDYEGYRITATPIAEGNTFRISATIEKGMGEETKTHKLIRADTIQGLDEAQAASLRKAKQAIDEQGDRIFT